VPVISAISQLSVRFLHSRAEERAARKKNEYGHSVRCCTVCAKTQHHDTWGVTLKFVAKWVTAHACMSHVTHICEPRHTCHVTHTHTHTHTHYLWATSYICIYICYVYIYIRQVQRCAWRKEPHDTWAVTFCHAQRRDPTGRRLPALVGTTMGWLRLVGSLKLQVSFAEYSLLLRALLPKRPIILRSLLIVATTG